jgi:hypothetical protein
MNMEIGTEAAQFPEKEHINGIFVAVCCATVLGSIPAASDPVESEGWQNEQS